MNVKYKIHNFLKKEYPDIDFDVSYPPEGFGDYSTNAVFLLAKKRKENPEKLALSIIDKLKKEFSDEFKEIKIEKNGFINFYLSPDFLHKQLKVIHKNKDEYGQSDIGKKKTVIVEYSQPNIAKVMHVGHLRSTIIGDALANIFENLGYKTIRWNYLGDWGTQFGNLIAAYKMWGDKKEAAQKPIETLNELYVRFHEELKNNPDLSQIGREEFKKLEEGDRENRKLWARFRKESIRDFNKIYEILGVKFDTMISESFFEKELKPLISDLLDRGIAKISQGAVIIPLASLGLPPALIQKKDGTSLYLTRDIANLKFRIKKYKPRQILYVVGNEQSLHFQQLFAVANLIGLVGLELSHVKFGLVLGEDKKKLSTREGRAVAMKDLIDKLIELARKTVEEKSPGLSGQEKDDISKSVGVGALKYFILKEHRNTDIVFDWNRMLDLKGDSGPYLQYTYARLASIKRKASKAEEFNFESLGKEIEFSLAKKLIRFPEIVLTAGESNLPNVLALYLYELANLANRFYESAPVLSEENEKIRKARLGLVVLTASVLKKGLNLLGIETPKRI